MSTVHKVAGSIPAMGMYQDKIYLAKHFSCFSLIVQTLTWHPKEAQACDYFGSTAPWQAIQ